MRDICCTSEFEDLLDGDKSWRFGLSWMVLGLLPRDVVDLAVFPCILVSSEVTG